MMPATFVLSLGLLLLLALGYGFLMRQSVMLVLAASGLLIMLLHAGSMNLQIFTWIKICSLVFAIALLWAYTRSTGTIQKNLGIAVWAILLLNIFEAVLLDAASVHYLNAAIGLSLMATQAGPSRISQASTSRPFLRYDLPWIWILTYTVWNLTFVCAHYPPRLFDNYAVLAAPLAAAFCLRDRQRWLEARCFILSAYSIGIVLIIDGWNLPWIAPAENVQVFYPWLVTVAAVLAVLNLVTVLHRKRVAAAPQVMASQ